jgi:Uncharacterized protein conserved in bacteria
MEPRKPVIGGKYRHFKNKLYQLLAVATHSETHEKYIVYQYPEVKQKYRFELMQEPER